MNRIGAPIFQLHAKFLSTLLHSVVPVCYAIDILESGVVSCRYLYVCLK